MSTRLLHHAWGIRGYTYVCTQYKQGNTIFRIKQNTSGLRSSCCGSKKVIKRGVTTRTLRTVPIGNQAVFIELPVQRVEYFLASRRRPYIFSDTFTKIHSRVFQPDLSQLFDACPKAPNRSIATAMNKLDQTIGALFQEAKLVPCKT
uniref:Zinc-finger of transposase IS204/IS1001/IS1096/IS1165 n=1 Tax=Candidatus Kentrum sp. TC TaxID=2126339 RepID=A0A450YZV3_9GAMM|nr:MAG: zinc-finger of transposase IS204/IS1001/IS1096/IS1165 [Candidatus Kentron sp. TC]VFK60055.1 MAG: zinc-finger of transposase IS204/IS1001/IS1096/IS1165 [Candidatus Kentron sp. TC]